MIKLFDEQFNDFAPGEFPYDKQHSALGEYHHYMPAGYVGNFYDPINNHQFRSMDGSWLIVSNGKKNFMQQNRGNVTSGHFANLESLLVHAKFAGTNFELSTKFIMLSTKDYTGIAFNYQTSQDYYAIKVYGHKVSLDKKSTNKVETLAFSFLQTKALDEIELKVVKTKKSIEVFINGNSIIFHVIKAGFDRGKIALLSLNPARYEYLKIEQEDSDYQDDLLVVKEYESKLTNKQKRYAPIKPIYKIDLKGAGSGRHIRVANVGKKTIFVFAQHDKLIYRDAFASISCLSAFDIDGKLLWRIGRPSNDPHRGLISCDLPMQITDIDNDGKLEFIYAKDFKIHVIDLVTGRKKYEFLTPFVKEDKLVDDNYPFDYLNVDAIRVADFTKKGYQGDLMVKDRYHNVWGLCGKTGDVLFRYNHKNTGHFPYVYDFDNDGIDEMIVGYDYVKNGKVIWTLPYNSDHTDEIIYAPLKDNENPVLLFASGNEGFNVVDIKGNIIKHIPVGHAQRVSLAKFDANRLGNQVCVTSFWGANGIVYTFDANHDLIKQKEFIGAGIVITPINYDNDENALILNNTDSYYGGLMDVNLDIVVKFANEGQPTLACEAFDIDNDGVDEILSWDMNSLWIYKASKLKAKKHNYLRYPHNAFSNYRGEYLIKDKDDHEPNN